MHGLAAVKGLAVRAKLAMLLGSVLFAFASCNNAPLPPAHHTVHVVAQATSQPNYLPINRPVATTGCGKAAALMPGTSGNVTIAVNPAAADGYHTRMYRLHIPGAYMNEHPYPVVLVFHGSGGDAAGMESYTGFSRLADQEHFIAAYPQGLPIPPYSLVGIPGKLAWSSEGPIDFGVDEALFVSNILDDLQRQYCVDAHRIYATGFSNGGDMINFLACRLAGRIAAFAPVSGNFFAQPTGCHPGRPVPMLEVHGTQDAVPYNGIPASIDPAWPLPSIPQWLQQWATRDGCTKGPVIFLHDAKVTGEQWTGCSGNATVVHYRMEGGHHAWPGNIGGQSGTTVIWLFFKAHPLQFG